MSGICVRVQGLRGFWARGLRWFRAQGLGFGVPRGVDSSVFRASVIYDLGSVAEGGRV